MRLSAVLVPVERNLFLINIFKQQLLQMNFVNITFPPTHTCLSDINDMTDNTGLAWEAFHSIVLLMYTEMAAI